MGNWDHFPSGNGPKKPLTKKQLQKMRDMYSKADQIAAHVRSQEQEIKEQEEQEANDQIDRAFL